LNFQTSDKSWKEKVYEFIEEKKLLGYKFYLKSLEKIFYDYHNYSVLVDPIGKNKERDNSDETDIKKITQWEFTLYITDVAPSKHYSSKYYDRTNEWVEISLGSGTLEEIKKLLNYFDLELPVIK